MPIGNRFYKAQKPALGTRSITLPDGQQFVADKYLNIVRADEVLTINLQTLAAPLTYAAETVAGAIQVMQAIINAATFGQGSNSEIVENTPSASVTMSGLSPDPIVAAGGEAITISGTGFSTLTYPYLYLIPPDGIPVLPFQAFLTIVNDTTMTCQSTGPMTSGACFVDLYDGSNFLAETTVTVS